MACQASEYHHFLRLVHDAEVEDQLQTFYLNSVYGTALIRHGLASHGPVGLVEAEPGKINSDFGQFIPGGRQGTRNNRCGLQPDRFNSSRQKPRVEGRWAMVKPFVYTFSSVLVSKDCTTDASDVTNLWINVLREKSATLAAF